MPTEFSRTTARKRITLPSGDQVDVPIITKISFIDPTLRGQEYQYTIENSAQSNRQVHVDNVPATNGTFDTLAVERIDKWITIDPVRRGQETQLFLDNVTGADSVPPHFSTHFRTHVVRYYGVDNQNAYIDSELIDEFRVEDPVNRHQETRVALNNPQTSGEAQANPDDPEISDSGNGIDPPWRTDPFQNIIGFGGSNTAEPFAAIFIEPSDFGQEPHNEADSGYWRMVIGVIDPIRLVGGSATVTGGPGVGYYPNNYQLDMRFVEQWPTPHTYEAFEDTGGTDLVRGYTPYEWDVDLNLPGYPSTSGPTWYQQVLDWVALNPAQPTPLHFDFIDYGFTEYLKGFYLPWWEDMQATGGFNVPKPIVIVRMTQLGPATTDNPSGRY